MWGTNPLLLWEKNWAGEIPPCYVPLGWGWGFFAKTVSLPLLHLSMWFFCSELWRSCSPSFQVFFRGKWSICNCSFGVSLGGGEFRIFLHCHLGSLPHMIFLFILVYVIWVWCSWVWLSLYLLYLVLLAFLDLWLDVYNLCWKVFSHYLA